MKNCFGIYIEKNIIKYAKIEKENSMFKIKAFNVEFYDDLQLTLKKIIEETDSYKTPICMNIFGEFYTYFDESPKSEFKDIKKEIKEEFKEFCKRENKNFSDLENRFNLIENRYEPDRKKVICISVDKNNIYENKLLMKEYKLKSLIPISVSISNLLENFKKDNCVIVNIEEKTSVTILIQGNVYRVDVLDDGMDKIFKEILKSETTFSKAYDACKEITLYSKKDVGETPYSEIVKNVFHNIALKVKEIIEEFAPNTNTIYWTGSGSIINNVEVYFQQYFLNAKCEVLKPFFLDVSPVNLPIKEFMEVSSAISLALNGLEFANGEFDFSKGSFDKRIFNKKKRENKYNKLYNITAKGKLVFRVSVCLILINIAFLGYSKKVRASIEKLEKQSEEVKNETSAQLSNMDDDLNKLKDKTEEYTRTISEFYNLTENKEQNEENRTIEKNAIPNLLTKIRINIPQKVRIISIKNSNQKHIEIEAEAEQYEQLGYFTTALKTDNVLKDIKSTSGNRSGAVVKVKIEGELP